ncbi:MAG: ABC transporter permease [Planctomycetes bacterium]|nr:ABC transporter permease [Planctomycetota bacterium]MCB9890329.1 ABC transporter permease [Planctomycetota bacterium]MCB9918147.1 ABC transporter permease [Planctomycetota bacterium]
MFRYVVRRLLGAIPMVLLVALGLRALMALVPGDASALWINPDMPVDQIAKIRADFGLDQPWYVQFWRWFVNVLQGDLGMSLAQFKPVTQIIGDALPNTLLLSGASMLVIFVVGMTIGVISAVKQYSLTDNVLTVVSFFLYSMPGFWLALMLILVVSELWPSWPSSGMVGNEILDKVAAIEEAKLLGESTDVRIGFFEKWIDTAQHLVMPVIALGLASAASVARYTRSSVLEVVRQDYVRTARAKGVAERKVILRHVLRNALLPVITILGLMMPFLVSGAVLIEYVFGWPGMGQELVGSVTQRDTPLLVACAMLLSVMVILGNLAADLLYGFADPRIRHD